MSNNSYTNVLKEASFTTMPGIHKQEIKFGSKIVYTSNILKQNVKKTVMKNFPKTLSSKINQMIDSDIILPVFKSKSVVNYIFKQRKKMKNHSLATTLDGKIFIFLETLYSITRLSSINEKKLATLITHELIHVADHNKPKEFLRINLKYFLEFYKIFFSNYLSVKTNNKDFIELIKQIEISKKTNIVNFRKLYTPIFQKYESSSNLMENEYQERFDTFIDYLDEFIEKFVRNVPPKIWESSNVAYKKIAGGVNETIGQEFWIPAEIISIISEINPKHPSVLKSISIL